MVGVRDRSHTGFDVGAHLHHSAEELFYILDGELDLLAFEPLAKTAGDWQSWQSAAGARVMRDIQQLTPMKVGQRR